MTRLSRRATDRLINQQARLARQLENQFAPNLHRHFDNLGKEMGRAFMRRARPKAFEDLDPEVIAVQLARDIGLEDWIRNKLVGSFQLQYRRVGTETVRNINGITNLGVMLPDPAMLAILGQGGTRAGLIDVPTETRDAIIRAVASGREAGKGPLEIARRIRDEVPKGRYTKAGSAYRAKLIARAETKFAQNASSIAAYKDSDVVRALLCFDARVGEDHDEACLARAGREFSFEAADREDLTHPNCSLSWGPVI